MIFPAGDPKHWREVLDVNVLGLSICTQQAFKLMKSSGVDDGHIVHINRWARGYRRFIRHCNQNKQNNDA